MTRLTTRSPDHDAVDLGEPAGDTRRRSPAATPLPAAAALAISPLHKRAFGMAIGLATGLLFFAVTIIPLARSSTAELRLDLLSQYFYGYTVSWLGAFVGLGWGFVVGFVGGWFIAFCRNLVLATSVFLVRTRAELSAARDFLDHI